MRRRPVLASILESPAGARAFQAILRALGRRAISRIETVEDGQFLRVRIRRFGRPLYWPAELSRESLYLVVEEQAYWWNPHNYEIPQASVRADDRVLDCGAAEGLFGLHVVDRCARLVLVEPLGLFERCLERTFAGFDRVTIVRAALSDSCGTARLEENGISSRIVEGAPGTPVDLTTVDALCARLGFTPTFVKADLEGSEPAMVRGARELLARHKPRLALTTYDDPSVIRELVPEILRANPTYEFLTKGVIPSTGAPFMLHAW
jgi:FkbM family methyltransferase